MCLILSFMWSFRHKKRRPWTSFFDHLVGRGNLKQVGIYLFLLANNQSNK